MTVVCFAGIFLLAPQLVHIFLGSEKPLLNAASTGRCGGTLYRICWWASTSSWRLPDGGGAAPLRPVHLHGPGTGATGRGAAPAGRRSGGGSSIWFAPLCSELLCFAMALILMAPLPPGYGGVRAAGKNI